MGLSPAREPPPRHIASVAITKPTRMAYAVVGPSTGPWCIIQVGRGLLPTVRPATDPNAYPRLRTWVLTTVVVRRLASAAPIPTDPSDIISVFLFGISFFLYTGFFLNITGNWSPVGEALVKTSWYGLSSTVILFFLYSSKRASGQPSSC